MWDWILDASNLAHLPRLGSWEIRFDEGAWEIKKVNMGDHSTGRKTPCSEILPIQEQYLEVVYALALHLFGPMKPPYFHKEKWRAASGVRAG